MTSSPLPWIISTASEPLSLCLLCPPFTDRLNSYPELRSYHTLARTTSLAPTACRLFFVTFNKNVLSPIAEAPGALGFKDAVVAHKERVLLADKQRSPGNDVVDTWHPQFFILAPTCPSSFLCSIRSPRALRLPPASRTHHALHTALLPASGPWCPPRTSVHPARPITKVAEVAADLSSTSPGLPAQRLCCHPTPSGLCPP